MNSGSPTPVNRSHLRVVTWNLLYRDQRQRLDRLTDALARLDAQIVCVQEILATTHEPLAERLGLHSHWAPSGFPPPATGLGCAVASRHPIVEARTLQLGASNAGRAAAAVKLRTPLGTVWAISAHLMCTPDAGLAAAYPPYETRAPIASVAQRIDEITTLSGTAAALAGDHVLLCGDLNLLPDSAEYRHLTACGWIDTWRRRPRLGSRATIVDANPRLPGAELTRYRHAHTGLPGRPDAFDYTLDYQMIRGETLLAAHAWTIGGQRDGYPSDHLGLAVDYRAMPLLSRSATRSPDDAASRNTATLHTHPGREPDEHPGVQ